MRRQNLAVIQGTEHLPQPVGFRGKHEGTPRCERDRVQCWGVCRNPCRPILPGAIRRVLKEVQKRSPIGRSSCWQ